MIATADTDRHGEFRDAAEKKPSEAAECLSPGSCWRTGKGRCRLARDKPQSLLFAMRWVARAWDFKPRGGTGRFLIRADGPTHATVRVHPIARRPHRKRNRKPLGLRAVTSRTGEVVSSSSEARNQFPQRRSNFAWRRQRPETIAWHNHRQSGGGDWSCQRSLRSYTVVFASRISSNSAKLTWLGDRGAP